MNDLRQLVTHINNPLLETITDANLNYHLWWKLRGPERPKYDDTMNKYRLLFSTSIRSYFNTLIILLYKLFDTDNRTNNMNRLVSAVEVDRSFSKEEINYIQKQREKALVIWKKVTILRNNYFAHLKFEIDEKNLYRLAKITPDELKELINLSIDILNRIRQHYREAEITLISPEDDIDRLFEDLGSK